MESPTLQLRSPGDNSIDSEPIRLLVVSRDASVPRLVSSFRESRQWHIGTAASGWDAMEGLQSGEFPQLLLLDIPRGDSDILRFLRWVRRLRRELPVVILCHSEEAARIKEELGKSPGDLVVRPFDIKQVEFAIRRQLVPTTVTEENMGSMVSKDVEPFGQDVFFVATSLIMQKLRAQAALAAKTDVPVLILGERGSGKFTVARLIHSLSVFSGFKLRRIHCAHMPEAVLAGELASAKGTMFLDEITALSASLQAQLVEILENDNSSISAGSNAVPSLRMLAASSMNIERALAEKKLREDLYYRLSAFTVHVPPLRQCKEEIPILLRYFMHKLAKHYGLPQRTFSTPVLEECQRYSWPGNLTEMETFVKRYLVAGDHEVVLQETGFEAEPGAAGHNRDDLRPMRWGLETADEAEVRPSPPESLKSMIQNIKSEAEKNAIRAALKTTGWNRKAAARLLRVSYRTLLYKIEQYQMRAPAPFLASFPGEELLSYEEVKGNGKAS